MNDALNILGFASGFAGNNPDCALGPWYLYYHPQLWQRFTMDTKWQTIIKTSTLLKGVDAFSLCEENLIALSLAVLPFAINRDAFCVIGGDHSCGIGTWSAVAHANRAKGDIGLIWIDAHMDSHTPNTSTTQNIHGMPVAHLLGHGYVSLRQILDEAPKLKPHNLCLVGVRSFEADEALLLKQLGVKIFFMDDILREGLDVIMAKACEHVTARTCGFGLSIDMDAIDPLDAPGVGYRVPGGILGKSLIQALQRMPQKEQLLGVELAEYNPLLDKQSKTAELIVALIHAVFEDSGNDNRNVCTASASPMA